MRAKLIGEKENFPMDNLVPPGEFSSGGAVIKRKSTVKWTVWQWLRAIRISEQADPLSRFDRRSLSVPDDSKPISIILNSDFAIRTLQNVDFSRPRQTVFRHCAGSFQYTGDSFTGKMFYISYSETAM
jgi:hypothetical protein